MGLSPYLWDLMLSLGRWCQNSLELEDTQLVLENCLVWGEKTSESEHDWHMWGIARKPAWLEQSVSGRGITGGQRGLPWWRSG